MYREALEQYLEAIGKEIKDVDQLSSAMEKFVNDTIGFTLTKSVVDNSISEDPLVVIGKTVEQIFNMIVVSKTLYPEYEEQADKLCIPLIHIHFTLAYLMYERVAHE